MFADHHYLELVRAAEEAEGSAWQKEIAEACCHIDAEVREQSVAFKTKAIKRATQLLQTTTLAQIYKKAHRRNIIFIRFGHIVITALGFLAVLQTTSQSSAQLNVFWLLLFLVGLNAVSFFLWLFFLLKNANNTAVLYNVSPLAVAYKNVSYWLNRHFQKQPALLTWSQFHLQGNTGYWFLSKHIHWAWLCYLLGGIVALLFVLSSQQFDFVWGTTLLSNEAFVTLTQVIGTVPKAIGFDVPSNSQILASRIDSSAVFEPSLRIIWSSFLFGSILSYAVLPRLIAWLSCQFLWRRANRNFEPNWNSVYFFSLRARLLPSNNALGIVDADTQPAESIKRSDRLPIRPQRLHSVTLPAEALAALYEWGDSIPVELENRHTRPVKLINTSIAQREYLSAQRQKSTVSVIYVPLERAADRGATRFFSALSKQANLYLVVVHRESSNSDQARLADWQHLSENINLPSDHFILASL